MTINETILEEVVEIFAKGIRTRSIAQLLTTLTQITYFVDMQGATWRKVVFLHILLSITGSGF